MTISGMLGGIPWGEHAQDLEKTEASVDSKLLRHVCLPRLGA